MVSLAEEIQPNAERLGGTCKVSRKKERKREKNREGRRWSVKCGRKPMETSI